MRPYPGWSYAYTVNPAAASGSMFSFQLTREDPPGAAPWINNRG